MCLSKIINQNKSLSQYEYFYRNNANDDILKLVLMSNKRFGSVMEQFVAHELCLNKVSRPDYDLLDANNNKYELKSSRRHVSGGWNFLHIEDKDFDFIMFLRVDFNKIYLHGCHKETLFESGKLRRQGNQGYMISWNDLKDFVVEIY